jgi:hypothetical protein
MGFKHLESSYLRAYKAPSTIVENVRQISPFYDKQTQFTKCPNERKLIYNNELHNYYQSDKSQKQTQYKPNQSQFWPNIKGVQCKTNPIQSQTNPILPTTPEGKNRCPMSNV